MIKCFLENEINHKKIYIFLCIIIVNKAILNMWNNSTIKSTVQRTRTSFMKMGTLNLINFIVGVLVALALLGWAIYMFVRIAQTGDPILTESITFDILWIIFLGIGSFSGVVSIIAMNNKAPIWLLIFSLMDIIFKLSYPVVELINDSTEGVNSTVLIGQTLSLFGLFFQVYLWKRWNEEFDDRKFVTETFKGKRTIIAVSLIIAGAIIMPIISGFANGWNAKNMIMDLLGAIAHFGASMLFFFGNIFGYLFFMIHIFSWFYFTISDFDQGDAAMKAEAFAMFVQMSGYFVVCITGFFQWLFDDFEITIVRKEAIKIKDKIKNQLY